MLDVGRGRRRRLPAEAEGGGGRGKGVGLRLKLTEVRTQVEGAEGFEIIDGKPRLMGNKAYGPAPGLAARSRAEETG